MPAFPKRSPQAAAASGRPASIAFEDVVDDADEMANANLSRVHTPFFRSAPGWSIA